MVLDAVDGAGNGAAHELTFAQTGIFTQAGAMGVFDTPGSDKQAVGTQGLQTLPERVPIMLTGRPFSLQSADAIDRRGLERPNPQPDALAGDRCHTGSGNQR